ncbi:zinc-ribbon domain-containing protein [Methylobacterium sp. CM6257]
MPKCRTCGAPIETTARICRNCGALTGVSMPSSDEPIAFGLLPFLAALAISAGYLLLVDWLMP